MIQSSPLFVSALLVTLLSACGGPEPVTQDPATQPPISDDAPQQVELVTEHKLDSAFISEPVTYYVVLPPSYDASGDRLYPVIYWLHGSGGFPPGMLQGLSGRFKGAMMQNKMPEALIVFPDGFVQSNWVNSKDGEMPMEDIIIQEVIPRIESDYNVIANPDGRLVEGGSMGGYGAARFGLKYSDMFAGVSMLNPGPMQPSMNVEEAPIVGRERAQRIFETVYGGDQDYFMAQSPWQLAIENSDQLPEGYKIRLILGADDPTLGVNQRFSEHLDTLSIAHDLIVLPDAGHNPREMFAALGEDYWTFFGVLGQE